MISKRVFASAIAAISVTIAGYLAFLAAQTPAGGAGQRPVWAEVAWPFARDLWGPGRAFRCTAGACGREIRLYLRAKVGFCNCTSTLDDEMVERVADIDLLASERQALGGGREIAVHSMKGRSRGYAIAGAEIAARSALAMAFHERCDLIVATAAIDGPHPGDLEGTVLQFLNSDLVLRWAEVTLGL
jgi:hypothetical protein